MTAASSVPLRYVFSVTSGATPASDGEHWGGEIPWVTPEDLTVRNGYWLTDSRRKITRTGHATSGTTIAPANSIVLSKRAPIGQLALLGVPACSSQGCFLLTPKTTADPRYFYYWLSSQTEHLQALGSGSTFMELGADDLKSIRIPSPLPSQQRMVADYLDRETARLDRLVAEKQRILRLLAEKRRALVACAVTRGLDPDVRTREAGVPWLGRIPAHWRAVRLRFLVDHIEQGWSPSAENRGPSLAEWGVLKLNAVNQGRFDDRAAKAISPETEPRTDLEVRAGDFLVTRSNTPLLVGDVCFVEKTRSRLMLSDIIYRLGLRRDLIDGRFLAHFLGLPAGRCQIEVDARGTSASMVKIAQEHIKDWWIPVPPIAEQREIVAKLFVETSLTDAAQTATSRTISLLEQRRSSLIAAAVSGQIDVGSAP